MDTVEAEEDVGHEAGRVEDGNLRRHVVVAVEESIQVGSLKWKGT